MMTNLTVSVAISSVHGAIATYLPGRVTFPARFLCSSNSSGVAFRYSAMPPRKSGVPTVLHSIPSNPMKPTLYVYDKAKEIIEKVDGFA
jgi:hypothetical protein